MNKPNYYNWYICINFIFINTNCFLCRHAATLSAQRGRHAATREAREALRLQLRLSCKSAGRYALKPLERGTFRP